VVLSNAPKADREIQCEGDGDSRSDGASDDARETFTVGESATQTDEGIVATVP
jgi:hypothetical protein